MQTCYTYDSTTKRLTPAPMKASYKIRFNPATTVDDINATLDAIDKAGLP